MERCAAPQVLGQDGPQAHLVVLVELEVKVHMVRLVAAGWGQVLLATREQRVVQGEGLPVVCARAAVEVL